MNSFLRIIIEIGRAVRFELLSTFGTLLTIFLATILPGAAWVTSKNLSIIEHNLKNNMTLDVFLRDDISNIDFDNLKQRFLSLNGVRSADFISKEKALEKMRGVFGPEMIQGLDDNPLPASFMLHVDQNIFQPNTAEGLIKKITSFPEVDDVVFAGEMINRLNKIMRSIEIIGLALSILVAFTAIFIVANTIRIAIADRRKTVEIMQLIGATRSYILTPFVLLGGLLGILGAALAMATLAWLSDFVSHHLVNVVFIEIHEIVAFVLSGLLLGMIGALIATRRYLKI